MRNLGLTGKHKLQDRWKSNPYVIVRQLPNLPVHEVKPECGSGSVRTLHRNHLLPIGYLVRISDPSAQTTKHTEPSVTRSQNKRRSRRHHLPESADSGPSDSGSEFDEIPGYPSFDIDEVERHVLSTYRQSNQIPKATEENMDVTRSGQSDADLPEQSDADLPEQSDADLPDEKSSDESEPENTGNETETEPELTSSSKRDARNKDNLTTRHSQRQNKPVIHLTYDKPGHSMDEPVTIVHHGMVIQLNLNPQITDSSTGLGPTPARKAPLRKHRIR